MRPLLLIFFVLGVIGPMVRAELFLGIERERIEGILELGYNLDPRMEEEIKALAEAFPESPVPGLLETGRLYWRQNYLEWDEAAGAEFLVAAKAAFEKAEAYRRAHKGDADALFVEAMIEMVEVSFHVDQRNWWSAFWKSRGGMKAMRKLVEEDPGYADAKLTLGMANCYLSKTPGYLKPLAFLMRFKGDWDTGIRYMGEAKEHGLFCRVDAGYYLGGIQFELERDLEAAREEWRELALRFPRNLKFRGVWAEMERGLNNPRVAWELCGEVLSDERVGEYPAILLNTLETRLWSSLGCMEYEDTFQTAQKIEAFLDEHPRFEGMRPWTVHARCEALASQGKVEEALALWASIESEDPHVRAAVARRSADVRGEIVNSE